MSVCVRVCVCVCPCVCVCVCMCIRGHFVCPCVGVHLHLARKCNCVTHYTLNVAGSFLTGKTTSVALFDKTHII